MTLAELQTGQTGKIVSVCSDVNSTYRLLEMGVTEGQSISVLGTAPLGDPRQYAIRGCRLAIRNRDAHLVTVEPVSVQ